MPAPFQKAQTYQVAAELSCSLDQLLDAEVVDLVFAMEDMERGLQEMAQSVEHMQEMLKRSPTVQALAQRQPEVRAASALRQDQENVILLPRGQQDMPRVAGST